MSDGRDPAHRWIRRLVEDFLVDMKMFVNGFVAARARKHLELEGAGVIGSPGIRHRRFRVAK